MNKQIHVCPECSSPYLETSVLASVKINSNFDWELDYQFPVDLDPIIRQPGTDISCTNCDWTGTWAETVIINNTARDGLQYDNGEAAQIPAPRITAILNTMSSLPDIKMGMRLLISDPTFQYRDTELLVIGITSSNCQYVTTADNKQSITRGKVIGFIVTPAETDMFQDVIFLLTGPKLVNWQQLDMLRILVTDKKPLPDLQDEESEKAIDDPAVRYIP